MSDVCILCGEPLEYLEKPEEMACEICGAVFSSGTRCTNGHYVCDSCHASPAESVIRSIASSTTSINPIAIANEMMRSPAIHMHGPEHHSLVGASLLAAYRNAGGDVSETALDAVIARGKKVPGGFCGMAGCCGAAVSAGIFYSVVTKTTPLSTDSWSASMRMTAACLNAAAEFGGPRCCKRDAFLSILTAVKFVEQELSVSMETDGFVCEFSSENAECLKTRCPFFQK